MKQFLHILTVTLLLGICSCQGGGAGEGRPQKEAIGASDDLGEITITREQFKSAGMKIGSPQLIEFSNTIRTNGFVEASRTGAAEISTLISGRVREIYHSTGDYVRKGSSLFTLESNEIILLQQTYAEAFQQMKLLQADFDRLKSLSEENIVARKDFLKAESDLKTTQAKAAGLRSRLAMIHIDPSQVEEGIIVPFQSVTSPINGYITKQELVLGQYIELNETPIKIIDTKNLWLSLQVFENAMTELVIGQDVIFSIPDRPANKFKATLSQLGKAVSADTRSVQCYATINPEDRETFLENMYVEAEIITCEREAMALPEAALIREPDRDFVLILVVENDLSYTFRKIPVRTGVTRQGFTEILDDELTSLLVEGVFSLWMEE